MKDCTSVTWGKLVCYNEYVCNLKESVINLCSIGFCTIVDGIQSEFQFIIHSCHHNRNNHYYYYVY